MQRKGLRRKLELDTKAYYTDNLHEYDLDLENNHIYLFGVDRGYEVAEGTSEPGVDFAMANRFIRNLNTCVAVNPDKPIVIHMKTCGGDWTEGIAIYDAIKLCPVPVTILSYTHARSMSSIILQAANKRVTMPNGYFMFHDGTYSTSGTVRGVESEIQFMKHAGKKMREIYVEAMRDAGVMRSDRARLNWIDNCMKEKEDVYFLADEAVKMGFFDEIYDGKRENLTKYTKKQLNKHKSK